MELLLLAMIFSVSLSTTEPDVAVVLPQQPRADETVGEPLVISMAADGKLFMGSEEVTRASLAEALSEYDDASREKTRVFVRVHPTLPHSKTMDVMSLISKSGFSNISLVQGGNTDALEGSLIPSQQ